MIDRIGQGSLAKSAIEAALKRQAEAQKRLEQAASALDGSQPRKAEESNFSSTFAEGLRDVDSQVKLGDKLTQQVIEGQVNDFAEVAATLKQTDLAFKFALEVRNKFVDAYREVMRMSV
ncbi:MAG: flagellar hook-basal body complex protein FliE [Planctomycetes bacterium]|nr:flagellar hook-basal body complex protein FliE [Planctomycetota bacterium]